MSKILDMLFGLSANSGTGNVVATNTPPQFDTTKQLATMDAVQRALGNLSGIQVYSANTNIPGSVVGKWVAANANGVTLTLPDATTVPVGSVLHFYGNQATGTVIARNGAVNIVAGSTQVASIALGLYDKLSLIAINSAWYVLGGEAAMKYSSSFDSAFLQNGYQKLPSGIIIQWGLSSFTTAGTAVTYPIPFPTTIYAIVLGLASNPGATAYTGGQTATGFNALLAAGGTTSNHFWVAIGR